MNSDTQSDILCSAMSRTAPPQDLPRVSDGDVKLVLGLGLLLQLFSWWRLFGYQLADSVEYMERAQGFLFGHEVLGPSSVRSFAFSALFLPFFWVADRLGVEDMRPLVFVFRIGNMLLGLALALSCMRITTRLADRKSGLVAGVLVCSNPIFLQYSISPVSGIAAGLCLALGLERALVRAGFTHHFKGGLWLGVGFMMAYQTLPISALVIAFVFLRDRSRHRASTLGSVAGMSAGLLGQIALDRASYGEWGSSIFRYVLDNAGGILVRILLDVGLEDQGRALYRKVEELHQLDYASAAQGEAVVVGQISPADFYLTELPGAVPWPVLGLFAIGLLGLLRRPRWSTVALLACFLANAYLMTRKGSKSFRLWLPLFPFLFPLCALGFATLRGTAGGLLARPRAVLATLLVIAAPLFGLWVLRGLETRRYGLFWEATDYVNARIESEFELGTLVSPDDPPVGPEGYGAGKIRVSGTYHWAMFLRESPLAFLAKLPYELDGWPALDAQQKRRNLDLLASLDWFVAHWPALVNHPDLLEFVNAEFTVEAAFYSHEADPGLAAVFVLKRKPRFEPRETSSSRTFASRVDADWSAHCAENGFTRPLEFRGGDEALRLLGFDYQTLPGTGLGWVSYHWHTPTGLADDWWIVDRVTADEAEGAWQNNHRLGHGLFPSGEGAAGVVLRESFLVVAGADAYSVERPFRALGGPYLAGELLPASLWMRVAKYDEAGALRAELEPRLPETERRVRERPTRRGNMASADGLQLVGRFLLPRQPDAVLRPGLVADDEEEAP